MQQRTTNYFLPQRRQNGRGSNYLQEQKWAVCLPALLLSIMLRRSTGFPPLPGIGKKHKSQTKQKLLKTTLGMTMFAEPWGLSHGKEEHKSSRPTCHCPHAPGPRLCLPWKAQSQLWIRLAGVTLPGTDSKGEKKNASTSSKRTLNKDPHIAYIL